MQGRSSSEDTNGWAALLHQRAVYAAATAPSALAHVKNTHTVTTNAARTTTPTAATTASAGPRRSGPATQSSGVCVIDGAIRATSRKPPGVVADGAPTPNAAPATKPVYRPDILVPAAAAALGRVPPSSATLNARGSSSLMQLAAGVPSATSTSPAAVVVGASTVDEFSPRTALRSVADAAEAADRDPLAPPADLDSIAARLGWGGRVEPAVSQSVLALTPAEREHADTAVVAALASSAVTPTRAAQHQLQASALRAAEASGEHLWPVELAVPSRRTPSSVRFQQEGAKVSHFSRPLASTTPLRSVPSTAVHNRRSAPGGPRVPRHHGAMLTEPLVSGSDAAPAPPVVSFVSDANSKQSKTPGWQMRRDTVNSQIREVAVAAAADAYAEAVSAEAARARGLLDAGAQTTDGGTMVDSILASDSPHRLSATTGPDRGASVASSFLPERALHPHFPLVTAASAASVANGGGVASWKNASGSRSSPVVLAYHERRSASAASRRSLSVGRSEPAVAPPPPSVHSVSLKSLSRPPWVGPSQSFGVQTDAANAAMARHRQLRTPSCELAPTPASSLSPPRQGVDVAVGIDTRDGATTMHDGEHRDAAGARSSESPTLQRPHRSTGSASPLPTTAEAATSVPGSPLASRRSSGALHTPVASSAPQRANAVASVAPRVPQGPTATNVAFPPSDSEEDADGFRRAAAAAVPSAAGRPASPWSPRLPERRAARARAAEPEVPSALAEPAQPPWRQHEGWQRNDDAALRQQHQQYREQWAHQHFREQWQQQQYFQEERVSSNRSASPQQSPSRPDAFDSAPLALPTRRWQEVLPSPVEQPRTASPVAAVALGDAKEPLAEVQATLPAMPPLAPQFFDLHGASGAASHRGGSVRNSTNSSAVWGGSLQGISFAECERSPTKAELPPQERSASVAAAARPAARASPTPPPAPVVAAAVHDAPPPVRTPVARWSDVAPLDVTELAELPPSPRRAMPGRTAAADFLEARSPRARGAADRRPASAPTVPDFASGSRARVAPPVAMTQDASNNPSRRVPTPATPSPTALETRHAPPRAPRTPTMVDHAPQQQQHHQVSHRASTPVAVLPLRPRVTPEPTSVVQPLALSSWFQRAAASASVAVGNSEPGTPVLVSRPQSPLPVHVRSSDPRLRVVGLPVAAGPPSSIANPQQHEQAANDFPRFQSRQQDHRNEAAPQQKQQLEHEQQVQLQRQQQQLLEQQLQQQLFQQQEQLQQQRQQLHEKHEQQLRQQRQQQAEDEVRALLASSLQQPQKQPHPQQRRQNVEDEVSALFESTPAVAPTHLANFFRGAAAMDAGTPRRQRPAPTARPTTKERVATLAESRLQQPHVRQPERHFVGRASPERHRRSVVPAGDSDAAGESAGEQQRRRSNRGSGSAAQRTVRSASTTDVDSAGTGGGWPEEESDNGPTPDDAPARASSGRRPPPLPPRRIDFPPPSAKTAHARPGARGGSVAAAHAYNQSALWPHEWVRLQHSLSGDGHDAVGAFYRLRRSYLDRRSMAMVRQEHSPFTPVGDGAGVVDGAGSSRQATPRGAMTGLAALTSTRGYGAPYGDDSDDGHEYL